MFAGPPADPASEVRWWLGLYVMTDQAFNTQEGDTLNSQGDSYLENVFSSDVVSAEIVAQCDVLILERMQRASKTCAQMITRIGCIRLRYYGYGKWLTRNYNDFCKLYFLKKI